MDFSENSLGINLLIFSGVAVTVWIAGTKVADYADELAQRYKLSRALLGLFLLAGITSLPEISTSFTAASAGNAELAVNNLIGSIIMQVALLAFADLFFGKRALTSIVPDPLVLLQGSLNIVLLALVTVAVTVGDVYFFGAGAWTWGLLGAAIYALYKLGSADRQRKPWVVNPDDKEVAEQKEDKEMPRKHKDDKSVMLFGKLIVSAILILVAGATAALSGEAIAEQSGLGQSFVGVALVAIATSLPEVSTVVATMRRGFYTMAISDIFGTNILNVALITGVDLIDSNEPVLNRVGEFSVLAASLGVIVTGLFMMGLSERADRTFLRMGVDSILVLLVYVAGMFFLYRIRDGG